MEPSDWIAIVALAASVIISIAGFWFNYRTNKENIKARRVDLVTEKSIEAYREVVEQLEIIETQFFEWKSDEALMVVAELEILMERYRVYFSWDLVFDINQLATR